MRSIIACVVKVVFRTITHHAWGPAAPLDTPDMRCLALLQASLVGGHAILTVILETLLRIAAALASRRVGNQLLIDLRGAGSQYVGNLLADSFHIRFRGHGRFFGQIPFCVLRKEL